MKDAVLHAETTYECEPGLVVRTRSRRCASLDDLHLLLQEVIVQLDNSPAVVEIDGSLTEPDLALRHPHLVAHSSGDADPAIEVQRFTTRASGIETCIAQRFTLAGSGEDRTRWRVSAGIGEMLKFRRYVAVFTSRDVAAVESAAVDAVRGQSWDGFEAALEAHAARWRQVWARADIAIAGRPGAQQALRFLGYHLSIAADRDPRVSVGARTLSGSGYQGHVFWDVEMFMLPFYVHSAPDVARCLLQYRHHTLDGARRRAQALGQRGACYAWESTTTGDDVTPRVAAVTGSGAAIPLFTGTQQIHVTADVAYAIWRYWEATRDEEFMRGPGAEILAETARFWAGRVAADAGTYHIRGVMGPDEYHHGVDDNAFTNWMARFNLEQAAATSDWLRARHPQAWEALAARIGLEEGEPGEWSAIARRLYVPSPNADGIIEQFAGFFGLEEYPLKQEEQLEEPLDRLFDLEKINGMKLLKQADVLMLPFLFPQSFESRILAANYAYYEPLTDHRSSLSPGVHAALAARLGLKEEARRYWEQSLMLDLSDTMSNSALGVHPASMGATWQALVFHVLGVHFIDGRPLVEPGAPDRLPDGWRSVVLELLWRGRAHRVEVAT
jgi:trehalose/maltose hydrolase-like predicted phosphorylase